MELIVVLVIGLPLALAVWLIVRAVQAHQRLGELDRRQARLERDIAELKDRFVTARATAPEQPGPATEAKPAESPMPSVTAGCSKGQPRLEPKPSSTLPPALTRPVTPIAAEAPPPVIPSVPTPVAAAPREPAFVDRIAWDNINWEQFMGVKLFAWIGGFALFLGVVFFVKYAFEHNLIPPEIRVAMGFLTGVGLLVGGVFLHRRQNYIVTAQTLCGTGIVILYATAYACRSIYKFEFFTTIPTFLLMVLITVTGFLLAVRLNAMVVAILGICGGFLTPVLVSAQQDNPLGLFGYIALLDIGLIAVAMRKRWNFLTLMGAIGTVLMQFGWIAEFFTKEKYFAGDKIFVALAVFFVFSVLFLAGWIWARRRREGNIWLTASSITLPAVALIFGFYMMGFESLGQRPGVIFGYALLIDLCLLTLVWLDEKLTSLQLAAGAVVFLLLTVWTVSHLTDDLLNWALVIYFVFAILHAALPCVLQQLRPGATPLWWGQLFPPVALLLMLAPILKLHEVSLVLWPFVMLVDLVVIVLAVLSRSIFWILGALALTVLAAGCWIGMAPAQLTMLPEELVVIGIFAVFFVAAGVFAAKRLGTRAAQGTSPGASAGGGADFLAQFSLSFDDLVAQVPALSAVLPFLLLILVSVRLPLADPSPVFALALLLVALLLGLTRLFPLSWLPAVGMGCMLALEHTWQFAHFKPDTAFTPLLWYLGFTLVFAGFPFLFWRQFASRVVPWATAALAGPLHFYLVHQLVKAAWPNPYMGLLPAAFALPSIASLVFLVRMLAADAPKRTTLLALFGGTALFFVTLIFPIQFDRQWITIGWALEGVALLWLFHRVPHEGLRLTGLGLLVTAFVRLAFNPAVLEYHERAATPIFNWYLYAYGIVVACLFTGVWLLAPPRQHVLGINARPVLATLGTILAFWLLNIEIADYFTKPGALTLTFEFRNNLPRDMTYSIAWGVFALGLVAMGTWRKLRASRYAGIALLSVTLLKLFIHDLASLEALYRIGAFLGVAVVAIAASVLYQRFLATDLGKSGNETKPAPAKTGD